MIVGRCPLQDVIINLTSVLGGRRLFKILKGHEQHSKTFPVLFPQMFMVHFMRSSKSFCVPVVGVPKNFETLVYKYIVHQKICGPVRHDPDPDGIAVPKSGSSRHIEKRHAHHRIEDKKGIVPFEPGIMVLFMVVPVQGPQKSVHYIFMGKPSHKLHKTKGGQKNKGSYDIVHCNRFSLQFTYDFASNWNFW